VIHLYRSDCGEATRVELRIGARDGQARCLYGGKVETAPLNAAVDYTMHATTARWGEMGKGDYGPMRAMMFGRLEFVGPKLEAMGVMVPFEAFLLLVGKVPGTPACPPDSRQPVLPRATSVHGSDTGTAALPCRRASSSERAVSAPIWWRGRLTLLSAG
jgi:putative sterol carrier protein